MPRPDAPTLRLPFSGCEAGWPHNNSGSFMVKIYLDRRCLTACACVLMAGPCVAQVTKINQPDITVLARKVENHGDHTVTFVRVKSVTLPKAPPLPVSPAPTVEEQATAARRANKSYESISITANVYLGARSVTELSWTDDDGHKYRAVSNIDFRLVTQLADVETEHSVYLWFPFVFPADGEAPAGDVAEIAAKLDPRRADYIFLGSVDEQKAAVKATELLDYLHAYAQLNDIKLRADLAKREADDQAAEEKRKKATPPSPVITFWLETEAKR